MKVSLIIFLLSITSTLFAQSVIELFTSEGCSSCPAADEALKVMTEQLNKEGKHVVALSFHITYWNHLGWSDPYSKEEFTERQQKYSFSLRTFQMYTPQAVANGVAQFIGSNTVDFRSTVEGLTKKSMPRKIDVATQELDSNVLQIDYTLHKAPKHTVLNIAIVEQHVVRNISRGENKNRKLEHYNIVREFYTEKKPGATGTKRIVWPYGLKKGNRRIVLYLQDETTSQIVGVEEVEL